MIVLVVLGLAGGAAAQTGIQVTKLRTSKVTIFKCDSGAREGDSTESRFGPLPWPVEDEELTNAGLIKVRVGGGTFCVRAYAVETNKALALPKVDCNAAVAAVQPRSGATRGVGQECPKTK
jgi:hypothetical protein